MVRREGWIPWHWGYRGLSAPTWVLRTQPGSSQKQQVLLTLSQLSSPHEFSCCNDVTDIRDGSIPASFTTVNALGEARIMMAGRW